MFTSFEFKSLRSRITVVFLTLILAVQLIGFIAIHLSIAKNARASVNQQLQLGQKLFNNLLIQNTDNLRQSARILATDYGFRQAIGTNDMETIESALSNHSSRIGANIAAFYSPDGVQKGIAGDVSLQMSGEKLSQLVAQASAGVTNSGLAIFNGRPYQLVAVPVKAPIVIGWIVMGFVIDNTFVMKFQDLSSLEATFLTKSGDQDWIVAASTLPEQSVKKLMQLSTKISPTKKELIELEIDHVSYGTYYVNVLNQDHQVMVAVLQRSINEAIAPYQALQLNLVLLTILGAFVFTAGSILTSKRIIQPLTSLVKNVALMGAGNYSVSFESNRQDEIGRLGIAFNKMREDISAREQSISKLAYWDELTQLPNRAFFIEQIQKFCEDPSNTSFSLLMMDMDRFKKVNDVLGQSTANLLLRGIAERLQSTCKSERDIVARLGGDEFGILIPSANSAMATEIAHRIIRALEQPIALNDQFVDLSASMGIATFPLHGNNVELLLSRAEIAMYVSKRKQNGSVVYENSYDVTSQENLSLATELRIAAEQNQLKMYVQPKIDLNNRQVIGAEALVRWLHPQRGMLFPDMFIPFAEQTGNVRIISMWMLKEAARLSEIWQQQGLSIPIAVNLSTRDLIDIELPNKLGLILAEHKLLNSAISVEITEGSMMDDPVRAQNTLARLANMGVKLSIDDFGTGYSSLAYLKNLRVNELKIDKSFVLNMEKEQDDSNIVRSTIELGHNLGLKVVAEGIENQYAWNLLQGMGCDYGQGYLMSKPMPAEQFTGWIQQWRRDNCKDQ